MNLDQVDFSPLQFRSYWRHYRKMAWGSWWRILLLAVVVIGLILSAVTATKPIGIVVLLVFLGYLGFYLLWFWFQNQHLQDTIWQDFAELNHWTTKPADADQIPPALRKVGHGHRSGPVVSVDTLSVQCELCEHSFTVGYSRDRKIYKIILARVSLSKPMPHIVLDSASVFEGWKFGGLLGGEPKGYQRLKLEGNFDQYFRLYMLDNQQIDVLSVITPDVMQTLIDFDQKEDIEIAGNYLYFIAIHSTLNQQMVPQLLQSVDKLAAEINHRVQTLNYTLSTPQT